ncbi:MAG: site-2 protease family protein, partial [Oscillochloris sp.]|nr:site-2 protease family protein [Oscillochloris sp.]
MTDMSDLTVAALRTVAAEVIQIEDVQLGRRGAMVAPRFIGQLRTEAQAAYDTVAPRFQAMGYTALLQQEGQGVAIEALPGLFNPAPSRLWLALLLFALTIGTTFMVGGQDLVEGQPVFNLGYGISYSAALLSILLAHEL